MAQVYVNHIDFEYEESSTFHDLPRNESTNTPTLEEVVVQNAYIYVNCVNLELPLGVPAPVEEEDANAGGAAASDIHVLGGRPWSEEDVYVNAVSTHTLGEEIFVHEILETYAYNTQELDTKIRRPIYKKKQAVEVVSFSPPQTNTLVLPLEHPKINSRQKEEEELLLLGII